MSEDIDDGIDEAPVKKKTGGARPGAGRPKGSKVKPYPIPEDVSMIELLHGIARGLYPVNDKQLAACRAAVAAEAGPVGRPSKKAEQKEAAVAVASKFAPTAPPTLKAVK